MDWVSKLAALGLHNEEIQIRVSPREWFLWTHENSLLTKYTAEPMGFQDMQFYGPSGIRIRVLVPGSTAPAPT